MYEISN